MSASSRTVTASGRTARRRVPRRVIWRRRLVALLALAALVALMVVLVLRLTAPAPDFSGTWAGSDTLLGGKTWRITHVQGDEYGVTGMKVDGAAIKRLQLDGGKLIGSGDAGGGTWSVSLNTMSNGNQLVAEYRPSEDAPVQRVRFTRVPTD